MSPNGHLHIFKKKHGANHSKSFIHFSYVICAFTYRIVELVFVLSYIRSRVWGSIEYSGTWCGDYYLIPRRLTALMRWKILDSVVNVVSEALSMHVAPPAIWIVVVPIGVTVMLGLCNPPRRGHGEPAKPGLLYPLVWIPCCDTVSEKPGSWSRVGSIASDLESWVMCCDR